MIKWTIVCQTMLTILLPVEANFITLGEWASTSVYSTCQAEAVAEVHMRHLILVKITPAAAAAMDRHSRVPQQQH